MSDRGYRLYLHDMRDSMLAIDSYLIGIDREKFATDRKTYAATLRELEIIGQAAGKLPEPLKSRYPAVNWRIIKDFRNVLAHEYFAVNLDLVWDIVCRKLPELRRQVELIIANEPPEG